MESTRKSLQDMSVAELKLELIEHFDDDITHPINLLINEQSKDVYNAY
jgi:hypothetical protein